MRNIVPRVAAIQDLSGFGRCSLTVIIPILSCMGVQVCPLPTAILSTHSGGFGEMAFTDLTAEMDDYVAHWEQLNLSFDYIYTGFLGNEQQIDKVANFFKRFKKGFENNFKNSDAACIVVDPVMGDNGKLYKTYDQAMQNKMKQLVQLADIITPNLTEAMFLLEREYIVKPFSDEEIKEMLKDLAKMGPKVVIVTGILDHSGKKANVAYDAQHHIFWKVPYQELEVHYPGTGDAFTSILIGALIQGDSLPMAIERASQFISLAIKTTYGYCADTREGIMLEKVLPALFKRETEASYCMI